MLSTTMPLPRRISSRLPSLSPPFSVRGHPMHPVRGRELHKSWNLIIWGRRTRLRGLYASQDRYAREHQSSSSRAWIKDPRRLIHGQKVRDRQLAAPAQSESLQSLVVNELNAKKHTAAEGLLWLVRSVQFFVPSPVQISCLQQWTRFHSPSSQTQYI